MTKLKWGTRDEWAVGVRTPYADLAPSVSTRIGDYATLPEVADLVVAMRKLKNSMPVGWDRNCINRGLRLIRDGELPICLEDYGPATDLLAPLHARSENARATALEAWKQKVRATPIDDAAWELELRRRARIDGLA